MNESQNFNNAISLYELNVLIQNVINESFYGKYFWVKAEIHKLNVYQYSGHGYPELLEKKENVVICHMRGIIWKSDLQRIYQKFIDTIGEPLKENINALILVAVRYEPKYGLNLQIKDIDPNYTLGELEKQKRETIEKLKKEGIFDANKKLELSIVPQRLAIISVETSKGYRDLISTFQKYESRFNIKYALYPSLLQGEGAATQIKFTLELIKQKYNLYDAVLIIRGGGGDVGLSSYNDYELCKTIASFPIPVITGIGHSTNFTVAEMVAHHNGITPTDTAMFIIQRFEIFERNISEHQTQILNYIKNYITNQKTTLKQISKDITLHSKEIFHQQKIALRDYEQWIKSSPENILKIEFQKIYSFANQIKYTSHNIFNQNINKIYSIEQSIHHHIQNTITHHLYKINTIQNQIKQNTLQYLQVKKIELNNFEKNLQLIHPKNILKRGYSIVYNEQNKAIKSAQALADNEKIKIRFYSTELEATINNIKIKNYEH